MLRGPRNHHFSGAFIRKIPIKRTWCLCTMLLSKNSAEKRGRIQTLWINEYLVEPICYFRWTLGAQQFGCHMFLCRLSLLPSFPYEAALSPKAPAKAFCPKAVCLHASSALLSKCPLATQEKPECSLMSSTGDKWKALAGSASGNIANARSRVTGFALLGNPDRSIRRHLVIKPQDLCKGTPVFVLLWNV